MIWHRQQVGLARSEPFLGGGTLALRAVPIAAAVVGNGRVGAILAARDMPTKRCGAAVLDRRHHFELVEADMAGIGFAPCRAMAAEDIYRLLSQSFSLSIRV